MNRYDVVGRTSDLSVCVIDHPPGEEHHDPEREVAESFAIAFVCDGTFDVATDGRRTALGAGGVLLTSPGMEYQCTHRERCPNDVCVSIRFEHAAVRDSEHAWMRARWNVRSVATPRLAYAQARLSAAVTNRDRFEIERWAIASLSSLESDAAVARSRGPYAPSRHEIDATIETTSAIDRSPAEALSVAERGRVVGMTGTELTRAFRRYVGLTPHRYVIRRRLALAAELLDAGESVSRAALDAGFENLSHFCRSFRRAFGARPSDWRTASAREKRRKVQALVS